MRLDAEDLREIELIGRRRMLQKALKKAGPVLRFSEHVLAQKGEAMFRHACAMGLEGIVSSPLPALFPLRCAAPRKPQGRPFTVCGRTSRRAFVAVLSLRRVTLVSL